MEWEGWEWSEREEVRAPEPPSQQWTAGPTGPCGPGGPGGPTMILGKLALTPGSGGTGGIFSLTKNSGKGNSPALWLSGKLTMLFSWFKKSRTFYI